MRKHIFILASLLVAIITSSVAKRPEGYYAKKAEESLQTGDTESALIYAQQEILDYEKNPQGYFQAALSTYYNNETGIALKYINQAIEHSKKDKSQASGYAQFESEIFLQIGDTVQAVKSLEKAIKLDSKNVDALIHHVQLITANNPKLAAKEIQKAKKIAPSNPYVYGVSAYHHFLEDDFQTALSEANKGIDLDNSYTYLWGLRGIINKILGNSPQWIQDCLKNYELTEDYEEIGTALLTSSESTPEKELIINEIEKNRNTTNGYYQLEATLLLNWGFYDKAQIVLKDIVNLGLADASTYAYLAACQKNGNIIGAYATILDGLNNFPDDSMLKYLRIKIGVEAGKGAELLDEIDNLIIDDPENNLVYVEKGRALMSNGRYKDAVEPFATAVMLYQSAENKILYGDALRLSGQMVKAEKEYKEVLGIPPAQILTEGNEPNYIYALAYSALGDRNNTIRQIQLLKESKPDAETLYYPQMYARLGAKDDAINALRRYTADNLWNALFDLYSYNFHNLHSEQAFVDLLAEHGVYTKFNKDSNLLVHTYNKDDISTIDSEWDKAIKSIDSDSSNWIENLNRKCPINLGSIGQITSLEYKNIPPTIIYNIALNPGILNLQQLNSNPDYKRKKEDSVVLSVFSNFLEDPYEELTLIYRFTTLDNSEKYTMTITPQRFKSLRKKYKSQDDIDKFVLETWAEEINVSDVGNTASYDGHSFSLIYPIPESDGALAQLDLFKNDIKLNISKGFGGSLFKSIAPYFIRQNITLRYIYMGMDSKRTVEIEFTPEEIKAYNE